MAGARAAALDNTDTDTHAASMWLQHMYAGDFEAAWQIGDMILGTRPGTAPNSIPRPIWNGTPLQGARVLIRCDHGLGDTIQFIRYAPRVRSVASRLIVWCQPALVPLLRTAEGIDELLPLHDGEVEADCDVDVEVMELPYIFRTTLNDLPSCVPYLNLGTFPKRTRCSGQLNVALVWKSGDWAPHRSVEFSLLRPLLGLPVAWHILQAGPGLLERPVWFGRLAEASEPLGTAREMLKMDLVISVDSMPAHLAGALGIPVWTLLPADADWRWMRNRDDSPWYPTMRLFRQPRPGDWDSVVRKVAETLSAGYSAESLHYLAPGARAAPVWLR